MNVRVNLNYTIYDGAEIVFKAPCDASEVTGLIVYYPNGTEVVSSVFTFTDAHTNDLGNIDNLFVAGAVVKVILDTETNMAFVQNAPTNAYLEGRFANMGGSTQITIGEGPPTSMTKGTMGSLYMDGKMGGLYKCIYAIESEHYTEYNWTRLAEVRVDMGAPGTWLCGEVGELYMDSTNGDLYICSRVDEVSEVQTNYIWVKVGGSVDLSNYYNKDEIDQMAEELTNALGSLDYASQLYVDESIDSRIGDISSALDGIIALQEELIGT